ncbi:hypothetical protein O7602_22450 [Micromonospora sp. WMMD1128]|uniref:hypothetical protein n=1 Tax=Micromonospora sp. WMMD1128 TaxID=3015150 RepID=UPI00248D0292|nr:hypothetical protein [Micromonospora sp. WMMD1128]WBB72450.1 hypothetical protein O7602_22450 [Micromonospora sp. WMMD1128]
MTGASNASDDEPHRSTDHRRAEEILAAFDHVEMDFTGSDEAWRYGGGRDLSRLTQAAEAANDVRGSL